MPSCSEFCQSE